MGNLSQQIFYFPKLLPEESKVVAFYHSVYTQEVNSLSLTTRKAWTNLRPAIGTNISRDILTSEIEQLSKDYDYSQ
jgi:hypothetical protein